MKRRFSLSKASVAALAASIALTATAVLAQGPGGPPPQGDFGQMGPGGQDGPPSGGFGGNVDKLSALDVPMRVLISELQLSSDQSTEISKIKSEFDKTRRSMMPKPGEEPSGGPESMRAAMDKMRTLKQSAEKKIAANLTRTQADELKPLLTSLDDLHQAGLPVGVYEDLKLSDEQKSNIATIAKTHREQQRTAMRKAQGDSDFGSLMSAMRELNDKAHKAALAALDDSQKAVVAKYQAQHPGEDRGDGPPSPDGPGGGDGPPMN